MPPGRTNPSRTNPSRTNPSRDRKGAVLPCPA
jgi:hypothetical protein